MLFNSSLDEILYPMTADIYFAQESQSDYGNMVRSWKFDRTVNCSAVTSLIGRTFGKELNVKDKIIEYNSSINFRTNEDIRKDNNNKYHPINAIAITNIRDANGKPAWINTENLKTKAETVKTKYEVKTIIPSFDMFHNIGMYRIFLTRSANQRWDIPE
jgi:hypothetical protein